MKKQVSRLILLLSAITMLAVVACQTGSPSKQTSSTSTAATRSVASSDLDHPWAYDPGPDPSTPMGRELIDLVATQPNMPGISTTITADQKFRPAFGPTLWRMIQKPNSVKILFIGQDGTHIAEAAGRTATAGFGGRAQDLAAYFGVRNSAAFINTFAFTIRGQYAVSQAPVISKNGQSLGFRSVIDNGTWLMSQDQASPMVKWRNSLIDWIIRNNKESLKMVVLFGGSARDSISSFIVSKGGQVGSRETEASIKSQGLKVPRFDLVNAGGNAEWPVVLDHGDNDIAQTLLEEDISSSDKSLDYSSESDQKLAMNLLRQNVTKVYDKMQIMKGGVGDSGLIHPAQFGGYDLSQITINGKRTASLQGLLLSDGSRIKNEVLVVDLPHPTYLSSMEMENKGAASELVAEDLKSISSDVAKGWKIEADPGMVNEFAAGEPYKYGRTDIGPAYYDFGTPKNRMVSKSDAKRMTGKSNVIILGSRDSAPFNETEIDAATKVTAPVGIPAGEMFSARPRSEKWRDSFDRGPGEEMARVMKQNLPIKEISTPKPGTNPEVDFLNAYNIKTDPVKVGDFGHFRGTFQNPKVVILADPAGLDDLLTSRALTGTRGQYLHGLMEDLDIDEQYVVIKTVPFGMDGATDAEWNTVLTQTENYRSEIFQTILKNGTPSLIIADGEYASKELQKIMGNSKIPMVKIKRASVNADDNSGLIAASLAIAKIPAFQNLEYQGKMANIPRRHLAFFSRVWEGTGGTRVFISTANKYKDEAFAVVAPEWAYRQKATFQSVEEAGGVEALMKRIDENQLIRPREMYFDYKKRVNINDLRDFWMQSELAA